ncbi:glucose-6-phosphate isomerase [Sphingomicrobium sediminis]|uniref:Glucose-6-phosphate isomerase n=1 Tax=Sphingomicrobium sediminis TaxID=2950949 RepID=A0A9X2J2N1_9SPHN|nr:glucose-6-phosphate isomerase [Sphingomicrobium sediminis]MCM8557200.1 glucose-6-phosphate isomerase [Sphingomicrobium sediminis]
MTQRDPVQAAFDTISNYEGPPIEALFDSEPDRLDRMVLEAAGIRMDMSKTHLDKDLVGFFTELAEAADLEGRRKALFSGEIVNPSEGRAATHVAERGEGANEDNEIAAKLRQRMRNLLDAIEGGAFGEVEAVLHIGIGGSVLGPALAVDALGREGTRCDLRLVANIDGEAMDEALIGLDPETTLIVAVSKSFTTTETLTNLSAALDWLEGAGMEDPYGRVIAVTANPEKAIEHGIDETRILPFADTVGGRYSLWSPVGISIAMALGWDRFEELLEGAAAMDRHFKLAPLTENLPVMAAFSDLYYTHNRGAETRAIFAYDERLRMLVPYLQQLVMESNGKSVTADGEPLGRPSSAILWGGVGTDGQHAVFQLLHQGSHLVPVEFLAVTENEDSQDPRQHRQLLLNAFAQGAALMTGRANDDDAARAYPGDRPSITLLMQRLDAATLGALIAFYEHRTYVEAALLGINPFDQFGVELGKDMARQVDDPEQRSQFDPSTRALIEKAGL